MSLSVTFNNRTVRVTTTPSMLLSDVRNKVCSTLLPPGELAINYSLRKSDKIMGFNSSGISHSSQSLTASQLRVRASKGMSINRSGPPQALDLSLPFRLAALPTGTKLELFKSGNFVSDTTAAEDEENETVVVIESSAGSSSGAVTPAARSITSSPTPTAEETVKIKLVLTDLPASFSSQLIQSFSLDTSLWQMLTTFQLVSGVNLTNRAVQVNDIAHYEISQLQTISKVVSQLDDLLAWTFRDLAFRRGSSEAIRVQWIDSGIDYEGFLVRLAARGLEVVNKPARVMNLDDLMDVDQIASNTTTEATTEPITEPTIETIKPPTRSLHIFTPSRANSQLPQEEGGDPSDEYLEENYRLTTAQARIYQAQLAKSASMATGPLLTKTLRDQQLLAKRAARAPASVFIRVRLPDMNYIQAQFDARETLLDVVDLVRQQLDDNILSDGVRVELFRNEGKLQPVLITESRDDDKQIKSEDKLTLMARGFCKRELLDLRFLDKDGQVVNVPGPLLKETVMQLAKELSLEPDANEDANEDIEEVNLTPVVPVTTTPEVKKSSSTDVSKKIPKWLKLGKK